MLGSVTKIIIFIESETAELEEGGAWLWPEGFLQPASSSIVCRNECRYPSDVHKKPVGCGRAGANRWNTVSWESGQLRETISDS